MLTPWGDLVDPTGSPPVIDTRPVRRCSHERPMPDQCWYVSLERDSAAHVGHGVLVLPPGADERVLGVLRMETLRDSPDAPPRFYIQTPNGRIELAEEPLAHLVDRCGEALKAL